jgi:alpha-ribazole phosphatase
LARLVLVRHGRTGWNEAGRYQGRSDVDLSAAGLREAEAVGERLAGERIRAIYCSDLKRAVQTAQTIAAGHSVQLVTCEELREMDFGDFEGLTFDDMKRQRPEFNWWTARDPDMEFPGGESVRQLAARVIRFLARLEGYTDEDTVVVVAHGGALRSLICCLLGLDLEHWWQMGLDSASLTRIDTYSGRTVLSLLNDVCHLEHLKKGSF